MSTAPGSVYGMTVSASDAGDAMPVTTLGDFNSSLVLLYFGEQWTFTHDSATDAQGWLCFHQSRTATISLGTSETGGRGAGRVTNDANISSDGPAHCIVLPGSGYTTFRLDAAQWGCTGSAGSRSPPLCRRGRCTVPTAQSGVAPEAVYGSGCDTDTDCGATGATCNLGLKPLGVHASYLSPGVDGIGQLQRAP